MTYKDKDQAVVLLHGIGHYRFNMMGLEFALRGMGYRTYNISYPSRRKRIDDLALWLDQRIAALGVWDRHSSVHFVAHSMGGLVAGKYLQHIASHIPEGKMGRVVMLGTPHGGSEVTDSLKRFWLYRSFFGPAGLELATDVRRADKIAPPFYDLGIVAGSDGSLHPMGFLMGREHPHDGCVRVESTRLDGARDHITLPVRHGFLAWTKDVQQQVGHFLENGAFER